MLSLSLQVNFVSAWAWGICRKKREVVAIAPVPEKSANYEQVCAIRLE